MQVVGLQLPMRRSKRVVLGVVLDAETDAVVGLIDHVPDPSHDEAVQAREAYGAVTTALKAYQLEAAVLFEADFHPNARVNAGTKTRLRLEGAVLTACRDNAPAVQVMNGQAVGRACNGKKKDALDAAGALGVDDDYVESAAAALAARTLA